MSWEIKICNWKKPFYLNEDFSGQHQRWEDGLYHCEYNCEYSTAKLSDMRRHIEAKHEVSEGFTCPHCGFHTPTSNSLRMHISRKHKPREGRQWNKDNSALSLRFFVSRVVKWKLWREWNCRMERWHFDPNVKSSPGGFHIFGKIVSTFGSEHWKQQHELPFPGLEHNIKCKCYLFLLFQM